MGVQDYLRALDNAVKRGSTFLCQYCGERTTSLGSECVCSNCEMPEYSDIDTMKAKNQPLFAALEALTEKIAANDYAAALAAYDSLYANGKDPGYLYAKALALIKQSNYQISMIKYDREGFMEENTSLRDDSARLASGARAALVSAIKACEPLLKDERPPLLPVYVTFLCHIKLGNLMEAGYTQQMLNKIEKYLGLYAKMMLDSNTGMYSEVLKSVDELLRPESFSSNALFYAALALYGQGKYKESKAIVAALKKQISRGSLDELELEIKDAETI